MGKIMKEGKQYGVGVGIPSYSIEMFQDSYTIPANSSIDKAIPIAKDGYQFIALAGFSAGGTDVTVSRCDIWNSDNSVHYQLVNNTSSEISHQFVAKIAYIKTS